MVQCVRDQDTTNLEIEKLTTDINSCLADMVEVLDARTTEIRDQATATGNSIIALVKQVATGAREVSSASMTLFSGAQESASSLEEITASMSEISSQTKNNAESAGQACDLAQHATKAAMEGQEAMQEMTTAMRLRFNMEPRPYDERTCIIVVNIEKKQVGLVVDTISEVRNIEEDQISPAPSNSPVYIKGMAKIGDMVVILLAGERILHEHEVAAFG